MMSVIRLLSCLILVLPVMVGSASEDVPETNTWTLVKEERGQSVYNRYVHAGSDVPALKVEGIINAPYSNVVQIVWDQHHEYPDFISGHLMVARALVPGEDERVDLYVYRMPMFSRLAVRAGSLFRGTIGKYQYCTVRLTKTETAGHTHIAWIKVATPDQDRPRRSAHEIARAEGYWEISPVDPARSRVVYVLDAYPGGIRVPEVMIRWANNSAIELPQVIEARYRSLQGDASLKAPPAAAAGGAGDP